MNRIFIGILVFVLASCGSSKSMTGDWKGTGDQVDGQKWRVELQVDKNQVINVNYPSLACSGSWTFVKSVEGDKTIYKEKITKGLANCDQGVEVHLCQKDRDELFIEYYIRSYDPVKPIASANLRRD